MKASYAVLALLGACVAADSIAWDTQGNQYDSNAYGMGVHSDQYGRAYTTNPDVEIKNNTYGYGNHSDQYGNPVQPKPLNDWGVNNGVFE